MARVTKKTWFCDRDALGREKPATATRRFSVEGTRYKLRLCEDHARMFDREMAAWSRLAAEEETVPETFGATFREGARRAAEIRAREASATVRSKSAECAEDNVTRLTPLVSHRTHRLGEPLSAEQVERGQRYSNGWALTEHAKQRAELRGYGIDDVLRAAAAPEISYDDHAAGGKMRRIHQAGGCAVAVDTQEKLVLTVLHRDEAKYALDHQHHLTERVAR